VITHLNELVRQEGSNKEALPQWLKTRVKDGLSVEGARHRLVEYGLSEDRINQFPPEQVLLLDEKREYEVRRDDAMKYMNLPFWQIEALTLQPSPDQLSGIFAKAFVPALHKVRSAQGRVEQRIALLQHVEALRLYAAAHAGKFPASLTECGVPLPVDPFTGQPFRYELERDTAHVRGSPPRGMEKNPAFNVHYEVTIQR